ncbi:MAG: dual specificity protein phosphatase family protein [Planctomycetaceae bacterium]|nr:dual specificity protein phosphatase family protein [Planctomycetaceae bacterium]
MREVTSSLWIGNAFGARNLTGVYELEIEAIVDLAIEEPPVSLSRDLVYCRIPIVDGAGNSTGRIRFAVDSVIKLITLGIPTLVACSAGLSRSPAIVAASLAVHENIDIRKSLANITESGPCDVHPGLLLDIEKMLCGES